MLYDTNRNSRWQLKCARKGDKHTVESSELRWNDKEKSKKFTTEIVLKIFPDHTNKMIYLYTRVCLFYYVIVSRVFVCASERRVCGESANPSRTNCIHSHRINDFSDSNANVAYVCLPVNDLNPVNNRGLLLFSFDLMLLKIECGALNQICWGITNKMKIEAYK